MRRPLVFGIVVALAVGGVAAVAIGAAAGFGSDAAPQASSPPAPMPGSSDVVVRPVDGGSDFYAQFDDGLPSDPGFFPVAEWFASVTSEDEVRLDRSMGINTYVELTADSSLDLIAAAGMHAIPSVVEPGAAGLLVADEVDMWAGAGDGAWTGAYPGEGQVCEADAKCGYTILEELTRGVPPGLMTLANFGKGVAFWGTEEEAEPFLEYTDVVSADTYWFSDPNICGASEGGWGPGGGEELAVHECRIAANYGWTVEYVRSLVSPAGSRPVWAFVEVGRPFDDGSLPTVTGAQIRAAVWSSLIHGARGVIYFNHGFGDECGSENVLRSVCGDPIREDVTTLNRELETMAPTLNAPFVDGLVTVDGEADVAVKLVDDGFTLLAASTGTGAADVTFTSACSSATTAEVVGEGRSIPVVGGRFGDAFADPDTVHVYRLDGGTCGL
ncbi:hypothetical protein [Agromyces sp. PvR057]|uniref:hypothetical protein n=1 Tax=Agromyces sp. PvR057 TaxID=3156403 RepID=UPI0033917648